MICILTWDTYPLIHSQVGSGLLILGESSLHELDAQAFIPHRVSSLFLISLEMLPFEALEDTPFPTGPSWVRVHSWMPCL